jgi:putative sterol carrier protein
MPVEIKKYFETDLPATLTTHADKARAVGAIFQLGVRGPNGGDWTVELSPRGPSCKAGKAPKADCSIEILEADFLKLCENPKVNALTLFMAGKLKVQGNQMLAIKLGTILALVPLPKAPAVAASR